MRKFAYLASRSGAFRNPKVYYFPRQNQNRDINTWAYVALGAVGIANTLYLMFLNTYSLMHKSKVNRVINGMSDIGEEDLPPGVTDTALGLKNVPFVDRNQPEIENLFKQKQYHFSILFGDSKVGKTTYLKSLMKGKKNVLFFQFKGGDPAHLTIESRLGLDGSGKENLPELLKIIEDAIKKIKEMGGRKTGEPIPLIVIEDILSLDKEEVLYIANKVLYFYDKRLCSVIMSSNNRTYNFFTDNSRVGGFERFRRYQIEPVNKELMRVHLERLILNEENVEELFAVCESNFSDILSILNYHKDLRYHNFPKAVDLHLSTYEDGFRELFRYRTHEETFLMFNVFDQLNEKDMVLRSYDLCFNNPDLYNTLDRVLYELGRENWLKRHSRNELYITYYRPILKHVYPRILMKPDVSQRRELYEQWKIEKGYQGYESTSFVLEFKSQESLVLNDWINFYGNEENAGKINIPPIGDDDDGEDDL